MKRSLLITAAMFILVSAAATAEGLDEIDGRNQLVFYPAFGVTGLSLAAPAEAHVTGFVGLSVEYGRSLADWLSLGLIPGLLLGNLGGQPVIAEPMLTLFAEVRPFRNLRRLFFRVALDQLGFVLPVPDEPSFFDSVSVASSVSAGYRIRLTASLALDVSAGMGVSYLPDRVDLEPVASVGLSTRF